MLKLVDVIAVRVEIFGKFDRNFLTLLSVS